MKDISEWLGHADIGTTMNIYGHLNLEHKRKLGDTLNGLLGQMLEKWQKMGFERFIKAKQKTAQH